MNVRPPLLSRLLKGPPLTIALLHYQHVDHGVCVGGMFIQIIVVGGRCEIL